jgi:hypothetical protein
LDSRIPKRDKGAKKGSIFEPFCIGFLMAKNQATYPENYDHR